MVREHLPMLVSYLGRNPAKPNVEAEVGSEISYRAIYAPARLNSDM